MVVSYVTTMGGVAQILFLINRNIARNCRSVLMQDFWNDVDAVLRERGAIP